MPLPPTPTGEARRLRVLRELPALDTGPEERFDRITRTAARLFQVPMALVSLVDEDRQWFKSCLGFEEGPAPKEISFCRHAILGEGLFLVEDALQDPRFRNHPQVAGPPYLRFFAGVPLRGSGGEKLGALGILDRSPRRFLGPDLEALEDLAAVAERELTRSPEPPGDSGATGDLISAGAFLSLVNHELRTPLTSLRGSLGLLAGGVLGPLPPKADELTALALHNTDRLVRLLNDLVDLHYAENGRLPFHLAPCDLAPILQRAEEAMGGQPMSDGASIAVELPPPEARVEADPERLVQALAGLLAARLGGAQDRGPLRLGARRCETGWRIEVEGPGEEPDASEGTGALRHRLARTLVEGMGGNFEFRLDSGRVFCSLELPEAAPEIPDLGPSKPRVLVVEDDPLTARLLEVGLQKEGFDVDKAGTAESALEMLYSRHYVAMTLDLLLPDRHGLELLKEIRQNPGTQDLRVLVASSTAEEGKEGPEVPALQVLEWIQKPLDPFRLAQAMACLHEPGPRPVVLHVEDDRDVHRVLSAVLEDRADLLHAPTLAAARKLLLSRPVDLVILDSHLPDGRGADLLPDVHAAGGPTLPVLLFSGEDVNEALGAEVSRTLQKSTASNLDIQRVVGTLLRESHRDHDGGTEAHPDGG